jgi:SAM-dependent methyltransferase
VSSYNNHARERDSYPLEGKKLAHVSAAIEVLKKENKKSILEIGPGPGKAALMFKNAGFDIECVDNSAEMIKLVKEKGIEARLLDCYELGKTHQQYNAVYSINCLLHMPSKDLPQILRSINGVLRDNGLFFLGLWAGDDFEGILQNDRYKPKRFFVFYSQKTLLAMITQVFRIDEYRFVPFNDESSFHNLLLRKL